MKQQVFASVFFLIAGLAACTKMELAQEQGELPPPERENPVWLEIAWVDGAWRYCAGDECPKPTPKTIAMDVGPSPVNVIKDKNPESLVADRSDGVEIRISFNRGTTKPTSDGVSELERFASIIDGGFHGKLKIIAYANSQKDSDAKMARKRGEYVIQWLKSRKINVPSELEVKVAQQEKSALPKVGIVIVPTTILFN